MGHLTEGLQDNTLPPPPHIPIWSYLVTTFYQQMNSRPRLRTVLYIAQNIRIIVGGKTKMSSSNKFARKV
jgi:hypothetical protein